MPKLSIQTPPPGFEESYAQFCANQQAIDTAWPQILAEHRGDWVAAHGGQLIYGDSIEGVVARAKEHGWPLGVVVIRPVRDREPVLL